MTESDSPTFDQYLLYAGIGGALIVAGILRPDTALTITGLLMGIIGLKGAITGFDWRPLPLIAVPIFVYVMGVTILSDRIPAVVGILIGIPLAVISFLGQHFGWFK